MDIGLQQAARISVPTPLPPSWLGRADAPAIPPDTASLSGLTAIQTRNLQAQIGYNQSAWDYTKIGANNKVGRYQFTTDQLETYGILAQGSNNAYGIDCINYQHCWKSVTIKGSNSYSNYNYNVTSLSEFLASAGSQEHLAYQILYDLNNGLRTNTALQPSDSVDIIAGMISVAWTLGVGTTATLNNPQGTGAYAWRYAGQGQGTNPYNSGRYAITILSQ
jgi:hypothetical protein